MKEFCTPLICTIFLLIFVNSANGAKSIPISIDQPHSLFTLGSNFKIISCPIDPVHRTPHMPCRQQENQGIMFQYIAIAPNRNYAYGTSKHFNHIIFRCHISVTDNLQQCEENWVNIYDPKLIAVHPSGQFMFVGTTSGSVYYCPIKHKNGMLYECNQAGQGFGVIVSMAISPHSNYIYLTSRHSSSVTVCRINPNNSDFVLSDCTPNSSDLYHNPRELAADPSGRYVYIADSIKNYPTICKSPGNTPNFQDCVEGDSMRNDDGLSSSGLQGITIPLEGNYVYMIGKQNIIYTCEINHNDGKFTWCASSNIPDLKIMNSVLLDFH